MSQQVPPGRWQPPPHGLGRLCPTCGAPLRDTDPACPRCGACPGARDRPAHLMTPFGHGMCAFIGAFMLGLALRSAVGEALPRSVSALAPVALAILMASLAARVGRMLLPQWRCSYEHLLVGGMLGGPAALMAALAGVTDAQTLLLLWAAAVAVTYLLMRRYGYRAADPGE